MKFSVPLLLLVGLVVAAGAQEITEAVFESCAGCRLNGMPEAKKFLREEVEPGMWDRVTVNFIQGHNPEVAFKDAAGAEVERLELWQKSYSDIVELLESRGFKRTAKPAEEEGGGEL